MPPSLALLIWLVLLIALFRADRDSRTSVSPAIWIGVLWFAIIASRLPSQWLGGEIGEAADVMEQGNPLDRAVYLTLIGTAIVVLVRRSFAWGRFLSANAALAAMLAFALVSVAWSDFPAVSFKRWIRDLGSYLVILVALSERQPREATLTVLRRLAFLLMPLSVVLIKYFPWLAKQYDQWSGKAYFVGVTTSKNTLGVLCLICGLYFVWDTLRRWKDRRGPGQATHIAINVSMVAMALWLLDKAGSATSGVCFALGLVIIVVSSLRVVRSNPSWITTVVPLALLVYGTLQFGFDVDLVGLVAEAVGRSPDLTGRTNIWNVVLGTNTNPLVGTGYEAFWLGPRLLAVWEGAGPVTEAHNGYLEVYLQLGFAGLALLLFFLVSSYVTIARRFRASPLDGALALALWTVLLFYNATESALRGQLIWIVFLLFAMRVPDRAPLSLPGRRHPMRARPSAKHPIGSGAGH